MESSWLEEEGTEQGAHYASQLVAGFLLHGLDHGGAYLGLVAHPGVPQQAHSHAALLPVAQREGAGGPQVVVVEGEVAVEVALHGLVAYPLGALAHDVAHDGHTVEAQAVDAGAHIGAAGLVHGLELLVAAGA